VTGPDAQAPGLSGKSYNAFCVAGADIQGNYPRYEDVVESLGRGMYVQLRMGSEGQQEMEEIFRRIASDKLPTERMMVCTDARNAESLCKQGHVDHILRRLVACGIDPLDAICMATVNPMRAYGMHWHGAIAPGYVADMVLFEDLKAFQSRAVFQRGNFYMGKPAHRSILYGKPKDAACTGACGQDTFRLPVNGCMPVICVTPGHVSTALEYRNVPSEDGAFVAREGLVKLVVMNRFGRGGVPVVSIMDGFSIKDGALATSVSYDTYSLVLAGDNDGDILLAAQTLKEMKGGYVVVQAGEVRMKVALPIMGIMSDLTAEEFLRAQKKLLFQAKKLFAAPIEGDPFKTLSFITLPTIPEVRVTEYGIYEVSKRRYLLNEAPKLRVYHGKQRRIP